MLKPQNTGTQRSYVLLELFGSIDFEAHVHAVVLHFRLCRIDFNNPAGSTASWTMSKVETTFINATESFRDSRHVEPNLALDSGFVG